MPLNTLYIDIDDLADAIAAYGREIRPGQVEGFIRVAREFMPDWSEATAVRFVEAAVNSSPMYAHRDGWVTDMPVHPLDLAA